jgi:DNA polymerase-1
VAGEAGFEMVEVERALTYAATDADVTLRLADVLEAKVREEGLDPLFREVEMPLVPVLGAMERAGVRIDVAYLQALSEEMRQGMERIGAEIRALAGHDFNIDSPKQLRVVLFEELGLKPGGRTAKTKEFSTRDEDLEELATQHPLPARLRDYRALAKLRSTYAESLPKLVHPGTGRVHTSFNQTGAASGRLSSTDPNLQNIPIRTEEGRRIRRAFLPEAGWRLVTADYSQIELRILAHMAGDEALIAAFGRGHDVHRETAARIFDQSYDLVTSDQRRVGKTINFGVVYGMSDFRLARELGIPRADAKRFIQTYFERYEAVRRYIDETIRQVTETGVVRTLFGRIRRFPDIASRNFNLRQQSQRAAVNTTIQGTAADLIKKAMIAIHAGLRREGMRSRLLIQVHDELVFEAPPEETAGLRALIQRDMEGAAALRVPLTVDFGEGDNWLDAK